MSSLSLDQRRTIIAQVIDQLTREPLSYRFFACYVDENRRGCVLAWAAHFAGHSEDFPQEHMEWAARNVFGIEPSDICAEARFYHELDEAFNFNGWSATAGNAVKALTQWLQGHPELLPQT